MVIMTNKTSQMTRARKIAIETCVYALLKKGNLGLSISLVERLIRD